MRFELIAGLALAATAMPSLAQPAARAALPPEIGKLYGQLGKAITTHDAAGVKEVWADDFVVNAPSNTILHRDEVIAAMDGDLLDYRDFKKTIAYVGVQPALVIVMGHDTMVPLKGPGAGKQVFRPFTDVWAKRGERWWLVARQATIASATP
ncbi:ketosteroid isomerase-like protein [Novosphingobium chloroacetimidivorans]|uniref:Ketosteroid isomerase-like protein n=1 Tax=Novosphingobium chloroacetimidivorans TaxID=1428314 RepID=A0A7W7NX35_9SPHN|nr:nuclear transport factor 2 family protein [Novosphingobium chloroacetimidivorans]MBB4860001.1 ketosteroid isomerase-like protein [Novosphingobium chloroacetimidivorans]